MKGTPDGRSKVLTSIVANNNGEVSTPGNRKGKGKIVQIAPSNPTTPSGTRNTPAGETPQWRRYDRSARKKSARALIEKVVAGDASDDDDGDQEDVAMEIYESEEEEEEDEDGEDGVDSDAQDRDAEEGEEQIEAATPSKPKRGRPRKQKTVTAAARKRKRSPTPPRDLPPHELYFAQNRPGQANKTSNNTLASLRLLTHDEYFAVLQQGGGYVNPHAEDIAFLQAVHAESFPQWAFELSQGFSVCLYGYGSKRRLLHQFASYLYEKSRSSASSPPSSLHHKIVIVNGYVRTSSLREILGTVAAAVDRTHRLPAGSASAMLDSLEALLASRPAARITVVLNSVDAAPLRRAGVQAALARLAAQAGVQLVCSADTPDFALLWDSALRSRFNFAFHDCTTFEPLAAAEADAVDDVHELLGRRARRVGGKEGVSYVLRSLPENAKNLFRLLVGEVLAAMDDDAGGGDAGENPGIEYRMLYNKAVEEFICSSEMAFRTLLKE